MESRKFKKGDKIHVDTMGLGTFVNYYKSKNGKTMCHVKQGQFLLSVPEDYLESVII